MDKEYLRRSLKDVGIGATIGVLAIFTQPVFGTVGLIFLLFLMFVSGVVVGSSIKSTADIDDDYEQF